MVNTRLILTLIGLPAAFMDAFFRHLGTQASRQLRESSDSVAEVDKAG
jgi:hypothetical protein